MLKKKLTLLFFLSFFFGYTQKQVLKLSNFAQISIITSGSGDALYEKFGHTSIRVQDPMLQLDLIYNYGIFDFNGTNFYINFTKGFMYYKLARYPFHYALQSAKEDKRWVKQQVLNLSSKEKNTFFKFLEKNALPENANYLYDPFFNNCATKPRDIINDIFKNTIRWNTDFTSNKSLRELMNIEIHQNTWGSLGINIALGNRLDKKATPTEYLYLPDYVFKALESATIKIKNKEEKLVLKTESLLKFNEKISESDTISPFLVFSLLLLCVIFITYNDYKNKKRTKWLDFILFFSTGIIGFLILFLWFFTNHSTAPNNFNLLWAFAPNLIVAFYLLKKNIPKFITKYTKLLLVLLLLIPFVWVNKIQLFNWTLIPLFLLLGFRYSYLQKTY